MTEHSNMSFEEQAEFLATQWLSVKQLEEAGKHGAAELRKFPEITQHRIHLRRTISQGSIHKERGRKN